MKPALSMSRLRLVAERSAAALPVSPSQWRALGIWIRSNQLALFILASLVGLGGGLGAVAFRYLIYLFTWLTTGRATFGQFGLVPSPHFPGLGIWFIVLAPAIAGLIYGPIIYLWAPEARGHGVPEVMMAVAERGGRIRPQVTVVKALASALCIGGGGSVGREGPIVQIGSALASTFGQIVRMAETRMRLLVACGAAAGISATFNAPLAGVFFGLELILREISTEAFVAVLISSMAADAVGQAVFGSHAFFTLPHLVLPSTSGYLLCIGLGLVAGVAGVAFQKAVYIMEDFWNWLWRGRPEWLRPGVGGLALGLLLLALPQMYGVGYPVLQRAITGGYVLWFLLALAAGKIVACSLTMGIGGSGGIFAPSLFIGATLGMAYGLIAHHLLGSGAGAAGVYAMVGMGAVFAAAARAPLTAIAAAVEMTGDYALVLPMMMAVAVATAISQRLSYGTIYTTKLLRRGVDVDRPKPATLLQQLRVSEVMRRLPPVVAEAVSSSSPDPIGAPAGALETGGPAGASPQAVFGEETLDQALRQLALYGQSGLPVMGSDGQTVIGWISNRDVMQAFAARLGQVITEAETQEVTQLPAGPVPNAVQASNPLEGYRLMDVIVPVGYEGRRVCEVHWPPASLVVVLRRGRQRLTPNGQTELKHDDTLTILVPSARAGEVASLGRGPG